MSAAEATLTRLLGRLRVARLDDLAQLLQDIATADSAGAASLYNVGGDGSVTPNPSFVGPEGPPGPEGHEGPPGPEGSEGKPGPPGPEGHEGPQGEKGAVGEQGPQGKEGPAGKEGAVGKEGPQGKEGIQGKEGPKGEKGVQGEKGPQGEKGAVGEQGPQGKEGPAGKEGAVGKEGPQGKEGIQGKEGPKGEKGATGEKGEKGEPGPSALEEGKKITWSAEGSEQESIAGSKGTKTSILELIANVLQKRELGNLTLSALGTGLGRARIRLTGWEAERASTIGIDARDKTFSAERELLNSEGWSSFLQWFSAGASASGKIRVNRGTVKVKFSGGTGSAATVVEHGLGVKPVAVILTQNGTELGNLSARAEEIGEKTFKAEGFSPFGGVSGEATFGWIAIS